MSLSQSSRRVLDEHLQSLVMGPRAVRPPKDLVRAVDSVRTRHGGGQAGLATQDRIEAAVLSLLANLEPSRRFLFVLSHALARSVQALGGRTVLQSSYAAPLLELWEGAAEVGKLKPLHWRGLFHSYMQADAGDACQRLRRLLIRTLGSVGQKGQITPAWLSAVRRHQGLLGDTPCAPYVTELVSGHTTLLRDLSVTVDLPDASWFWVSLRDAVVLQIDTLDDLTFKSRLEHLVSLPQQIPNSRDDILIALLRRYSRCNDRSPNIELMELALNAWGSPQLQSNKVWTFAGDAVRQMVCGWLAQEDLEDFYRLCQGTGQVDDRRLKFWLRFKEQMVYTQILLGNYLRDSRDGDIREFVKKKGDRIGHLTSGSVTNNAIVMQIGGWVFVEFSETGNACYAYPIVEAAINLGLKAYTVGQLKPAAKSLRRLIHRDGHETWEQAFQTSLRQVGFQPDNGKPASEVRTAHSTVRTATTPKPLSAIPDAYKTKWGSSSTVDEGAEMLLASLRKLDVRIVDHRHVGGAIWAYPNRTPYPPELAALGMKLKTEKKGYYWP